MVRLKSYLCGVFAGRQGKKIVKRKRNQDLHAKEKKNLCKNHTHFPIKKKKSVKNEGFEALKTEKRVFLDV